jgi:hypothetical protein
LVSPRVRHFDELDTNAVTFDLGDGPSIRVCDLDDQIRMKRASGRPKDRIELEVLGAVRVKRRRTEPRDESGRVDSKR